MICAEEQVLFTVDSPKESWYNQKQEGRLVAQVRQTSYKFIA